MDRADRETWAKRVERWGDSGLSAREFASELGIKSRSLRWWKWRLAADAKTTTTTAGSSKTRQRRRKRGDTAAGATPLTFVELTPTVGVAPPPIEIVLRSGTQLRVTTGFDATTLERILEIVERRA